MHVIHELNDSLRRGIKSHPNIPPRRLGIFINPALPHRFRRVSSEGSGFIADGALRPFLRVKLFPRRPPTHAEPRAMQVGEERVAFPMIALEPRGIPLRWKLQLPTLPCERLM